ncbi:MAG: 1-acyl-sn-glycerol-3-phosphate acyltransferase [Spirochaetes bacterium]|nr:1-acyl-sn-glycerol-3-phosphate acyltransferase [Spirochaetota bacterium]
MLRTVAFLAYFWFTFPFTHLLFVPLPFFRLFKRAAEEEYYVQRVVSAYCFHLLNTFGVRVRVRGIERLPKTGTVCFVSNHQGLADIGLIEAAIPMRIGFIAKRELERVPLLAPWLRVLHCVMIERSRPRKAYEAMQRGVANIRAGRPIVLFPEGTRSRSRTMAPFLAGSMMLPIAAGSTVVPLTVDGTYRLVEEENRIRPGVIDLVIHDPIDASKYSLRQRRDLADRLWHIVHEGLETLHHTGHSV